MNPVAQLPSPKSKATSATEGMLLGALLDSDDPRALLDKCALRADQMIEERVKSCWTLIEKLSLRDRYCDAETVFAAGRAANDLADADREWLRDLQAANSLDAERFEQVAENYRRTALGRAVKAGLLLQASEIDTHGLRPEHLAAFIADLGQQLTSDYAPDDDAAGDLMELIHEWNNPSPDGKQLIVPTHIPQLDEILGGGFVPSFNCILGDPGIGKSASIGSIIKAQTSAGMKVGLAGLEEGHRWMSRRLLAAHMGLKIADIGRKQKTPEEDAKLIEAGEQLHPLLQQVKVYPFSGVSIDALLLRIAKWASSGVQIVYIDHIGEIRHRATNGSQAQDNWAVAESYRRLRDLAKRVKIPIVGLAHRKTASRDRPGPPAPPHPNDVGLTGEAEKMIRVMLGLWRKNGQLRGTTIKNNEGPSHMNSHTVTVEFEFIEKAGLFTTDGGTIIDLELERRNESRAAREKRAEIDAAKTLKKREEGAAWKAKQDAEKAKQKAANAKATPAVQAAPPLPPQLTLLEGGEKPPDDPREDPS